MALVSLVAEDRQWFKSRVGLDLAETSRDVSFCAHTILGEDVFEVPDALEDERFHDNPLVTGKPRIRFYAGVPLVTSDGHRVGALCVMDRAPRRLTTEQRMALTRLGRGVSRQFETRLARTTAATERDRIRQILDAQYGFVAVLDTEGVITEINRAPLDRAGMSREAVLGRRFWEVGWLAPEAVPWVRDAIAGALTGEICRGDVKATFPGADPRDVDAVFSPLRGSDGRVEGVAAFAVDISDRRRAEQTLREAEERYHHLFDLAPYGIVLVNPETHGTIEVNAAAARQLGYTREEMLALEISDYEVIETPEETAEHVRRIFEEGSDEFDTVHITKWGERRNVRVSAQATGVGGKPFFYCIYQDVTDRLRSERRYQRIVETAIDGFWVVDARGMTLEVNDAFCRMLGYTHEELLGMAVGEVDAAESPEETQAHIERVLAAGFDRFTTRHRRKDGTVLDVDISVQLATEGEPAFISFVHDTTERERTQVELRAALREKDMLMREIHHRVKNNLQIISSLLYFQAEKVVAPQAREVFAEARQRLTSMILVHESLYGAGNFAELDFAEYVRALVKRLVGEGPASAHGLRCTVEAVEVRLPMETALPAGMILVELLTNVDKHAYPEGNGGEAIVRLMRQGDRVNLSVQDQGVGLPATFDPASQDGFGWQLIHGLLSQLGGEVGLGDGSGAHFVVSFPFPVEAGERLREERGFLPLRHRNVGSAHAGTHDPPHTPGSPQ